MSDSGSYDTVSLTKEDAGEMDEMGLPLNGPYGGTGDLVPTLPYLLLAVVVEPLIGFGLASLAAMQFDPTPALASMLAAFPDIGHFYLAMLVATRIPGILQILVAVGRKKARVPNPDQYIYRVRGQGFDHAEYVKLEMEGDVGSFNRAQRGMDNFRETFAMTLANALLGGFAFAKASVYVSLFYMLGCVLYQFGYSQATGARGKGMLPKALSQAFFLGCHVYATKYFFFA